MKKTFLRILPLAVAVLLATSCSKDENNNSWKQPKDSFEDCIDSQNIINLQNI